MKPLPRIALLATLACAASAAAFAASASTSTKPTKPAKPAKPDAATLASHLAAVYAVEAPYDLNVNGALETAEQDQLAAAITDGSASLPPPPNAPANPPADAPKPPVERILPHLAALYAAVAPYDVNVDGTIASDELAALQAAITDGSLKLPPPGGKGPGGPGKDGGQGKPKKGPGQSGSSS